MKDFKDKVLVVTGAGHGIGRAIAIEGAQRGMKVVINDICAETLAETKKMIEEIGVPVVEFATVVPYHSTSRCKYFTTVIKEYRSAKAGSIT